MVNSGTEASMSAVRLARAATGRDKVVKFAGAYHGHVDGLLAEAGSGLATQGLPASPGVTEAQAADTIVVPWNDPDAVAAALSSSTSWRRSSGRADRRRTWGWSRRPTASLSSLRELADENGALLIFDEVITGFRVARGGAQEALRDHARPDPAGKGAGRRPARRGLRWAPRADGASGAGRRRLPGRDAVRQSAGGRRGAGDPASASTATPTDASAISPTGWRPACAPRPATAPCRWRRRPAW